MSSGSDDERMRDPAACTNSHHPRLLTGAAAQIDKLRAELAQREMSHKTTSDVLDFERKRFHEINGNLRAELAEVKGELAGARQDIDNLARQAHDAMAERDAHKEARAQFKVRIVELTNELAEASARVAELTVALAQIKVLVEDPAAEHSPHTTLYGVGGIVRGVTS